MYKAKSEGLEGNIRYLGAMPRNKLLEILTKAMVFIFQVMEGGGIAVVEVMVSGLQVVAWNPPVLRNYLKEFPNYFSLKRES